MREADHRIANHLAMLSGFVGLQLRVLEAAPEPLSRDAVRLALEAVRAQVGGLARLHRVLARDPRLGLVAIDEPLHEICDALGPVLGGSMALTEDLDSGSLVPAAQVLPITQIVSEAITNAAKHGRQAEGRIAVTSRLSTKGELVVQVTDSGPGPPAGFEGSDAGLGYRLIRALCRRLNASFELAPANPGARFQLSVPLPTEAFDLTPVNVEALEPRNR